MREYEAERQFDLWTVPMFRVQVPVPTGNDWHTDLSHVCAFGAPRRNAGGLPYRWGRRSRSGRPRPVVEPGPVLGHQRALRSWGPPRAALGLGAARRSAPAALHAVIGVISNF